MLGTMRWNLFVGGISFLVTFFISIASNIWLTTLLRSFYSFLVLFALVFLFRWVLGTVAGLNKLSATDTLHDELVDEQKGTSLDVSTPDEAAVLHQILKDSLEMDPTGANPGFAPLTPPKLSTSLDMDAVEMAQAVRTLTEE